MSLEIACTKIAKNLNVKQYFITFCAILI